MNDRIKALQRELDELKRRIARLESEMERLGAPADPRKIVGDKP